MARSATRSDRVRLGRLVADEAGAEARVAREAEHLVVLHVDVGAAAARRSRACATAAARHLAGTLHQLLEALVVHREPLLGQQLLRHLVGEAEGVVQLEGVLRGHPRGLVRLGALDHLGSSRSPCSSVRLKPSSSARAQRSIVGHSVLEVGVGVTHHVAHALAHAHEEGLGDAEHVALLDRAAHDAAQDVAAVLVGGHDAVGQQDGGAAAVVGDHAERAGGREVVAVLPAGQLLAELDQRGNRSVSYTDGTSCMMLAIRSSPRPVSMFFVGSSGSEPSALELVLHEDEVPELEEALGVVARPVRVRAEVGTAVEVELRAGPARARRAGLPEVVVAAEQDDALVRHADRPPVVDRLLVGTEAELLVAAEHGDPDVLEGRARSRAPRWWRGRARTRPPPS